MASASMPPSAAGAGVPPSNGRRRKGNKTWGKHEELGSDDDGDYEMAPSTPVPGSGADPWASTLSVANYVDDPSSASPQQHPSGRLGVVRTNSDFAASADSVTLEPSMRASLEQGSYAPLGGVQAAPPPSRAT